MKITINKPESHLYHRYPGQTAPQGTFLELNPSTGEVRADWNGEIGNAIPMAVGHGRILRWALPNRWLTAVALGDAMDDLEDLLTIVAAGYGERWDGNNMVGDLDDDAQAASEAISDQLNGRDIRDGDLIEVGEDGEPV